MDGHCTRGYTFIARGGSLGVAPRASREGGSMAERPPRRVTLMAAICAATLLISGLPAAAQASNPSAGTEPSDAPAPPPPQPEAPMPQKQPLGAAPAGLPFLQWPRATG